MDGFDDLLSSSRGDLEDNPFADPFLKRSSSPDPWANPYAQQQATPVESSSVEDDTTTDALPASDANERTESTPTLEAKPDSGPLDLTALDEPDEQPPPPSSTSTSGFREFTVAESPKIPELVEGHSSLDAPTQPSTSSAEPTQPAHASESASVLSESASASESVVPPSTQAPAASWEPPSFVSPLDKPQSPIAQSFANLPLGSEGAGGWQAPGDWQSSQLSNDGQPSSSAASWHSRQPTDEEDEDDKPLQAIVDRSRADAELNGKHTNGTSSSAIPLTMDDSARPMFSITVEDPQKVGDPIRGYTMYTVQTSTTSAAFRASFFSVLRRYSDFLWLYETLSLNNPGVVVPPVPEKSPFGRFENTFVQQRRVALEKCINKIAAHPVLQKDPDLKMFLESDSFSLDIKQRKAEMANERGGLMASIGQTIAGPRFHETDEWYDQKKAYLDSLEIQLRGLVKSIDIVAKHRAELSIAIGEFAQSIAELSASDLGTSLSRSVAGLADIERKSQELQATQSQQDVMTFMSTADEYARLINSVRLAFNSRIRTFHARQNADAEVRRVKQVHERNRAQGRAQTDRPGYAMSQIAEAERRAMDAKQEFEQCSRLIKSEVARFEQERIEDFKLSLQSFLDGMIASQKRLIAAWESYQQTLLKHAGSKRGSGVDSNGVVA